MTELKPCPFCGSKEVEMQGNSHHSWVVCDNCSTEGPVAPSQDEAVERWNERAS